MGRGRAKAKQTKVARRLKYSGPDTDLAALENELRSGPDGDEQVLETPQVDEVDDEDPYSDDEDDLYAKYADDDERR